MLEFGKKVNYRPLLVSLLFALLVVSFFNIFHNTFLTVLSGIAGFLLILLVHYYMNLPLEFKYWRTTDDSIQYSDLNNWNDRIWAMLVPPAARLTTIKKRDIAEITVKGDLNKVYSTPSMIPFNTSMGIFSSGVALINNQHVVKLTLKNDETIDLDISRDFVYSRKDTIKKLNQLFKDLHAYGVEGDMPKITAPTQLSSLERKPSL